MLSPTAEALAAGLAACAGSAEPDAPGSLRTLYRPDVEEVIARELTAIGDAVEAGLRRHAIGYRGFAAAGGAVRFTLRDSTDVRRAQALLARIVPGLDVTIGETGAVTVALAARDVDERRANLLDRTAEMMETHFDGLGIDGVRIAAQQSGDILVVLPPGTQATRPCGCGSSGMALRFVDEATPPDAATLPPGVERLAASDPDAAGVESYAVEERVIVSGRRLLDAEVQLQNGVAVVAFELDPVGSAQLAEATAAAGGRRLAIVVDREVIAAPVIRSPMTDGRGIVDGAFTPAEAEALARTMRAAAPAPAVLRVVKECLVTGAKAE